MRLYELAWQNVKSNLKNYLSLILSLAFTVLIFFNFQNLAASDLFAAVGEHNQDYSNMLIQTLSVVLGVFMVFFIGYATNVFLTRRKKEIGIFIFMGLTNQKIGMLYMMEMAMVGIVTLVTGIGLGILTAQLFQMVLLAMSEITVEIGFSFSLKPIFITSAFYLAVYLAFVLKGYGSIVRSSVLELVSASRQNEYVRQRGSVLFLKTVLGVGILSTGYYLAVKEGGQEVLRHAVQAVVLVIVGVYFLFGGLIPAVFQGLVKNKLFLYRRERGLWVNQMVFRMKKNYRTYAIVCVLMICSVTALSTSFALKERYEGMVHFRNTYTYQLLSNQENLDGKARQLIGQANEIAYSTKMPILMISAKKNGSGQLDSASFAMLAWTPLKQLAKDAGLKLDGAGPGDGELIEISHLYLLSLLTKREGITVQIFDRSFLQIDEVNEPYLGYLQETMSFYLVNDAEYEELLPLGEEMYAYNYRIQDVSNYEASVDALGTLVSKTEGNYTARIVTGPDSGKDWEWVKILYSLCVFLVMVFITASGGILFMKLYNDAFEEQGRYGVLQKMGYPYKTLKRAVARELLAAYTLPLLVMGVSSYFSVHALENMMYTSLARVRLVSVAIMAVFFYLCYWMSVRAYLKNAGVGKKGR